MKADSVTSKSKMDNGIGAFKLVNCEAFGQGRLYITVKII